jgi:hypothetical protein
VRRRRGLDARAVGVALALLWVPAIGLGGASSARQEDASAPSSESSASLQADTGTPASSAADSGTEPAAASRVTVEATADKTEVTVGETFALTVKASGPAGTEYTFPAGASEDAFELSAPAAEEREGDAVSAPPAPGTHRYEAAVYTLGTATLPSVPVRYRLPDGTEGQVETKPVTIEVVSMLPKDPEQQKLADIQGPRRVGIGRAFWVALVLGLLVLAAVALWIPRWRRRSPSVGRAPLAPPVPPDVEALGALGELAASGLLEAGAFRSFYIRLTLAAKRYLERRLEAPVLEMTTAETLAFLRSHDHGGDVLPVMRDLAGAADRIKFARGQGLAAEAERHLAAVRALVPALEARLRPPAPGTPEEGKAA